MIDNIMNDYGYLESGIDNTLMNNVLDKDNTVGLGKNTTSKTEGSWPFDQTNHSNGSTPMGTLDIMSFYKKEPTPPTPTGDYMYFESAESNSTVSMISTLATAPDLEYSTDGQTWQEWQHATADGTHTFDTLTLTEIGDRVYLRGVNPNGLADVDNEMFSYFSMNGKINSGGNIQTLVDGDTPTIVAKPLPILFGGILEPNTSLLTAPDFPAIVLSEFCYYWTLAECRALQSAPDFSSIVVDSNSTLEELDLLMSAFVATLYNTPFDITDDGGETLIGFPKIEFPFNCDYGIINQYMFAGGGQIFGLLNMNGFDTANLHLYSDLPFGERNINTSYYGHYVSTNENGGVVSWWVPAGGVDVELIDNTTDDYSTITKWQMSEDGENWIDIPDSANRFLTIHLTQAGNYYYKVIH